MTTFPNSKRMILHTLAKPHLATHILTFMVSGILSNLEFPYVYFPCTSVSGDELYSLVRGCVRRLESCGLKVIALTCDGASANHKFFKPHKSSTDDIIYKTINPYADEDRPVFFYIRSTPPDKNSMELLGQFVRSQLGKKPLG